MTNYLELLPYLYAILFTLSMWGWYRKDYNWFKSYNTKYDYDFDCFMFDFWGSIFLGGLRYLFRKGNRC